MEIPKQLIECLKENKVSYEVLHHPEAVTAQRIAQAEHVKGRHHAKVVMVKSGDQHLMMVLPADHQSIWRRSRTRSATPSRWIRNRNSSRSFPIAPLERCHPLAVFMVCQRMWTRVWRSKITSCSKQERTPTRSKWATAITRKL